jgi:glycosyltransferase involved in cell wall biosynthesis
LKEDHPEIDAKLLLIGDAGFGYDEVLYAIEEFDLESQVQIPGWVKEEDMPYIFNAASAFIFPSKHEGFGIPVLQALGCGLPAAVSDLPVLREVAGAAALYFDHNNKVAVAAAMYRIINDQALRDSLRAKGLARAGEFSWRRCAEETLALFNSL